MTIEKDMDEFRVFVDEDNTLVVAYDVCSEPEFNAENDEPLALEFRFRLPGSYEQLIADAQFIDSIKALMLHILSVTPFHVDEHLYLKELGDIMSMRQALYNRTCDLIDKVLEQDETASGQIYNNFMFDFIKKE
ncbi:hypothetical protein [Acinetobacter sp.]|uniref:hypothetical protein n=1 Tax=Acinetobacter sp. TaxID=472 RepID=UPI003CFFED7F